jgi:hypothetical protein
VIKAMKRVGLAWNVVLIPRDASDKDWPATRLSFAGTIPVKVGLVS